MTRIDHITPRRARAVRLDDRHRRLAAQLKTRRTNAGVTGRHVARTCGWQESKITKIESGEQFATDDDLRAYLTAINLPDQDRDTVVGEWDDLRREIRKRELLQRGLAEVQHDTAAEEALTTAIRVHSSHVVPGLLQTPGYARALLGIVRAFYDRGTDDLDAAVDARMRRQHVLYRGIPITLIVTEAVLRTPLADNGVMLDQIEKIRGLMLADVPGLRIGVVPLDMHLPVLPTHAYWVEDYDQDTTVTVELVGSEINERDPWQIKKYREHFTELEQIALFDDDARALLARIADRYRFAHADTDPDR